MAAIHRLLAQRSFNVQRRGLSAEMIMSTQQNGGQAFPVAGSEHNYPIEGMTMRDYFAAKAMQAMISVGEQDKAIPGWAYGMADAMLRARETS